MADRRMLGPVKSVTSRQLAATTSFGWGDSRVYITMMSVRKFKIRRISEVLVNSVWTCCNTNKKFIVLKCSFKKRALQIGLPRDKDRNFRSNEKLEIASLHMSYACAILESGRYGCELDAGEGEASPLRRNLYTLYCGSQKWYNSPKNGRI
jgi:hypothetical protein